MVLMGVILAATAWITGYRAAAWGIVGGTPVGLVNYALTMTLVRQGSRGPSGAFQRSLAWRLPLRFVLAVTGLLLGYWVGVETMIGVVVGETLEVLLYILGAAGIAARALLGRLRSGHV
ncbi:ATP synthase subunit I [Limnochorda pilosa]|uniref:Uncharacterized protein n=1 Tax=Limnochorda pilosa TaxID=1555112 RepID=A0A0K2SPJ4_LIMPI|nr:ATP synthase subunit I [Limnochorda pilosa]BAS28922.1 hypothetical protein LIP_3093 [Limnochorda pilosa]